MPEDAEDAANDVGTIVSTESNDNQDPSTLVVTDDKIPKANYYTIPQNITLYHGSKSVSMFDTAEINFGQEGIANYVSFFTPDRALAEIQISKCEPIFGDNQTTGSNGWLHVFRVKANIDNIKLISDKDKDLILQRNELTKKYCIGENNTQINGVGFFRKNTDGKKYISYVALCLPKNFLEYTGTYQCSNNLATMTNINSSEATAGEPTNVDIITSSDKQNQ